MVLDGLRGYLQLANGLTDVTRERARLAAKNLLAQGEASMGAVMPDNVRAVTDDLIATSKANRDLLLNLVRSEVERSVSRLGLVSAVELESAIRRARRLEERVMTLESELRTASRRPETAVTAPAPVAPMSTPSQQPAAQKSAAKRTTSKRTSAKKATTKRATTKKATTKKATAKKATAKKATKKSATRKTTAKKTTSGGTTG
jgi:polyhydroxyalkanoate synthesis regulator phasin